MLRSMGLRLMTPVVHVFAIYDQSATVSTILLPGICESTGQEEGEEDALAQAYDV